MVGHLLSTARRVATRFVNMAEARRLVGCGDLGYRSGKTRLWSVFGLHAQTGVLKNIGTVACSILLVLVGYRHLIVSILQHQSREPSGRSFTSLRSRHAFRLLRSV